MLSIGVHVHAAFALLHIAVVDCGCVLVYVNVRARIPICMTTIPFDTFP